MHELGPEPNFNESMYFNVFDPSVNAGGFFRLGNRANEGVGEMTVCVWLPEGRVGFMFARPSVTTNDAFDAGGMSFEVVEPFEELRVSYTGDVILLDDPLALADPRAAFERSPRASCEARLTYTRVSPMFGGEPDEAHETAGQEFARGHYEQLVAASGSLSVGEDAFELSGYGLRDHSWGPRYWQAPWYYRWLTANFGPDFGFMGSRIARRDGPGLRGGFVWDDGEMHLCDDLRLSTTWDLDEGAYQREVSAELASGSRRWLVHGRVRSVVPLRNRRRDLSGAPLVTRIAEGLTTWTMEDGRIGHGLSEYLDQMVDGAPVGLHE